MTYAAPLVPATLHRRYKRFLADCTLADGAEVTAHCANPGSMMGLADPGTKVWLEPNDDPKKKLKWALRQVELADGTRVGVDTALPNRLIRAALRARALEGMPDFEVMRAEMPYGENSRVDFMVWGDDMPDTLIEVKSVTLSRAPGVAEFPDSVTARGTKHLRELTHVVGTGCRAFVVFVVQRSDAKEVQIAQDIDPGFAEALRVAHDAGVEIRAYGTEITPEGISLAGPLPVTLPVTLPKPAG